MGVMVAPIVPALTDHEIEKLVEAAANAGAFQANYIYLRLPYDVKDLFETWLHDHFPDRARHVLSLVEQARGGKRNDPRFHHRMTGQGAYAAMISQRFAKARARHGLDRRLLPSRTDLFTPPRVGAQMELFV